MRVLRSTLWCAPNEPSIITVVRDSDVIDSLESVRLRATESANRDGMLVLTDLFDMEDGSSQEATLRAGVRTRGRTDTERAQALLYYWTVGHWPLLSPGGMVLSDRPAPLSVEEIKEVLVQLLLHPNYKGYGHVTPAQDGTIVTLRRDGRIE